MTSTANARLAVSRPLMAMPTNVADGLPLCVRSADGLPVTGVAKVLNRGRLNNWHKGS